MVFHSMFDDGLYSLSIWAIGFIYTKEKCKHAWKIWPETQKSLITTNYRHRVYQRSIVAHATKMHIISISLKKTFFRNIIHTKSL